QATWDLNFEDLIVLLDGWRIRADEVIRSQKPSLTSTSLSDLRNTMQANRTDRLRFSLQATVAEIKPNGNLVLEADGTVAINNEVSKYTLSGVVSPLDVDLVKRSVKSEKITNKYVRLDQVGPTRDSIKRGWLTRVFDMIMLY